MNKKSLLYVIILIVLIIIISISSVFIFDINVFNVESDFKINGENIQINEIYEFTIDKNSIISLYDINFSIPNGFKGNVSYDNSLLKLDLSNGDNFIKIYYYGIGTAKTYANDYVNLNHDLKAGNITKINNWDIVEIIPSSNIAYKEYILQNNDNIFGLYLNGLNIQKVIN
ncbi:hypothetical protein [Methanobrevibacter curvatus]|uniref:Uncharacterized protein n=1 Tax=Methanobrevibacter curvatus TaxID=49547 RepID=A0A165Z8P3_9EURY|nr:hypothetical protein [Methanobrevibacter curvatus]KZX10399.1 hypothetical protein MBCUR_17690 [Methanobrevibacter curvatus]